MVYSSSVNCFSIGRGLNAAKLKWTITYIKLGNSRDATDPYVFLPSGAEVIDWNRATRRLSMTLKSDLR